MSPAIPRVADAKSHLGVVSRRRDASAIAEARRDLAAAKVHQYIERTLEDAPPLTDAQRLTLARLLQGGASA